MNLSARTFLAGVVIVVAAATIAAGFLVVGSPAEARRQRLDERRVSDLRQIRSAIDVAWTRAKVMPDSIESAMRVQSGDVAPVDPSTRHPYEYRVLAGQSFELCAVFERASEAPPAASDPLWAHVSGRQCFPLTARDLSKPPEARQRQ